MAHRQRKSMQKITISVLSVALMFSLTTPVVAATSTSSYWNQNFTASSQRLAVASPQQMQKKKNKKPAPIPAPAPTPAPATTTPPTTNQCSTGWYVTGYFTPIESDYSGATQAVTVAGTSYTFNSAFLTEVKTEGWGKTHLGNYIGYYDNKWHFANAALDAHDTPLKTDAVAIDPSLIAFGTKMTISTLPQGYGTKVFTASDIGTAITGKHIDVYTGEGSAAEAMTYKITGNNNTVCTVK